MKCEYCHRDNVPLVNTVDPFCLRLKEEYHYDIDICRDCYYRAIHNIGIVDLSEYANVTWDYIKSLEDKRSTHEC